jgi:hypothetical protein
MVVTIKFFVALIIEISMVLIFEVAILGIIEISTIVIIESALKVTIRISVVAMVERTFVETDHRRSGPSSSTFWSNITNLSNICLGLA